MELAAPRRALPIGNGRSPGPFDPHLHSVPVVVSLPRCWLREELLLAFPNDLYADLYA